MKGFADILKTWNAIGVRLHIVKCLTQGCEINLCQAWALTGNSKHCTHPVCNQLFDEAKPSRNVLARNGPLGKAGCDSWMSQNETVMRWFVRKRATLILRVYQTITLKIQLSLQGLFRNWLRL